MASYNRFNTQTGYADAYGDPNTSINGCSAPDSYVAYNEESDCDDSSNSVSPAETELCDGLDNNCNG